MTLNPVPRSLLKAFFLLLGVNTYPNVHAQLIRNPNMEGNATHMGAVPPFWVGIPYTNPICKAHPYGSDTPDLCDSQGPAVEEGVFGLAHSGGSFVSGTYSRNDFGLVWHEGIGQYITQLNAGCLYELNFWQSVVKQRNLLDPSGFWKVHLDTATVGQSEICTSHLAFDDANLAWVKTRVLFTPKSAQGVLAFMPYDDDEDIGNSQQSANGGIRLGIDLVDLQEIKNQAKVFPERESTICKGDSLSLLFLQNVAQYLSFKGNPVLKSYVKDPGIYIFSMPSPCGLLQDSFELKVIEPPVFSLGKDTVVCEGEDFLLQPDRRLENFQWSDGSGGVGLTLTEDAEIWLLSTTATCTYSDTIRVAFQKNWQKKRYDFCTSDSGRISIPNPAIQLDWEDGFAGSSRTFSNEGRFSGEMHLGSCASFPIAVQVSSCKNSLFFPNLITPNRDEMNDEFWIRSSKPFLRFSLKVYNRWGNLCFQTKNPLERWSGIGKPDAGGTETYFWTLNYAFEDGIDTSLSDWFSVVK